MIIGEGPLREPLAELAKSLGIDEMFSMPGFQINPFPYMAQSSVFVLSSKLEGLPNVLIQALACGTPVVSTDCHSGPREILEGGRWGRLTPVGDPDALGSAVLETLDAPVDREALEGRGRMFGVDKAVEEYVRVLIPGGR